EIIHRHQRPFALWCGELVAIRRGLRCHLRCAHASNRCHWIGCQPHKRDLDPIARPWARVITPWRETETDEAFARRRHLAGNWRQPLRRARYVGPRDASPQTRRIRMTRLREHLPNVTGLDYFAGIH